MRYKSFFNEHVVMLILFSCCVGMFPATVAQAVHIAPISSDVFLWTDPDSGGEIEVTEEVFDHFDLDTSLYTWRYTIFNFSYDPIPLSTTGLSGFQLVFPAAVPEFANQFGPAGWVMNAFSGIAPPFGAEWDIDDAMGIPIGGSDVFGFTTFPREDVVFAGSWMHTWQFGSQDFIFTGDISVPGPIPEPATMALLGIGLSGLVGGAVRRRFKRVKK